MEEPLRGQSERAAVILSQHCRYRSVSRWVRVSRDEWLVTDQLFPPDSSINDETEPVHQRVYLMRTDRSFRESVALVAKKLFGKSKKSGWFFEGGRIETKSPTEVASQASETKGYAEVSPYTAAASRVASEGSSTTATIATTVIKTEKSQPKKSCLNLSNANCVKALRARWRVWRAREAERARLRRMKTKLGADEDGVWWTL